jgi:hypothetical protein
MMLSPSSYRLISITRIPGINDQIFGPGQNIFRPGYDEVRMSGGKSNHFVKYLEINNSTKIDNNLMIAGRTLDACQSL